MTVVVVFFLRIGINDKILGGICKIVSVTLHRYKDTTSQSYVKSLITAMLKQHPDAAVKHLTCVIIEQALWHTNVVPT